MKVRAIRLREVGCFREAVALEGLSGELDVLAGPNEMGKSTLFKALRALFAIKHTSTVSQVRNLRPHAGGNPLIEADFEIGAQSFRLRKQFLGGKTAILQDLGSGDILARGPDAEEQLAALLGMDEVQAGRLDLMWVRQKGTLEPTSIPPEARTALDAAIAAEVEVAAGGARARAIGQCLAAELKTLVTERQGRPAAGSDFLAAVRQRDDVEKKLERARADAARAADRLERLAILRDDARAHSALDRLDALKRAASEAADQVAKAGKDRAQLHRVQTELRAHEAEQREALRLLEDFEAKSKRLAEAECQSVQDVAAVDALAGQVGKAEATRAQAYRQRDLAEAELNEASSAKMTLDQAALTLELARQQTQLQRALEGARKVETSIALLERERGADPLTDSKMDALEREHAAIAALEASAVTIEVSYLPDGQNKIRHDGRVLAPDGPLRVSEPTVLDIDGVGTLTISPGEHDAADALSDLTAHRAVLADLLNEAGVDDVAAARALRPEQRQREMSLAEARAQLAALAPDGLEALEAEVTKLQADAPAAPANGVDMDRAAVESRFTAAGTALTDAQKAAAEAEALHQETNERLLQRQAEAVARRDAIANLAADLPGVEMRDGHHAELTAAREAADTQVGRSVVAQRTLADVAVDDAAFSALEANQKAAEEAGSEHTRKGQRLTEDMRGLEGEIAGANEDGSELLVRELEDRLVALERQVSAFELRVESLGLIKDALDHAAASTRDTFLAPVVKRMAPYFETVFPGVDLQFREGLNISGLTRQAQTENLSTLSEGTQEQIAVLVRLGFGRLLADSGSPLPLILDDALVYSDDTRIARVFDALAAGAAHHQVVVLTCRTRTFAPLAGHRLELSEWKNVDVS